MWSDAADGRTTLRWVDRAVALQAKVLNDLEALEFRPARWVPLPNVDAAIRPPAEVAARLMALDALFTWVAFPEDSVATSRIEGYIESNGLRRWLTADESAIVALSRAEARRSHVDAIGWKLENMWALAWVLGFEPEPGLEAAQVGDDVIRAMIHDFLPGLGGSIEGLLAKATPRPAVEVISMEYRFYAAHNAVRSAQLDHPTVPEGFHPILHGGAVHERRYSLSWCVEPEVSWEETDLST